MATRDRGRCDVTGPKPAWVGRRAAVGVMVLTAGMAACGEDRVDVTEVLGEACLDARDQLAAVPAPADDSSDVGFLEAAGEAAATAADAGEELVGLGDDQTIADLVQHLRRFPGAGDADQLPGVAYEAIAVIDRIDGFAEALIVPECGAATWRPADWRAMAARSGGQPDEAAFRRDLNQLCEATFPNPSHLTGGTPLLEALGGGPNGGNEPGDATEVKALVLERLNTVSNRPSGVARFIREFSSGLPDQRPSDDLEDEHVALLAAFMHVDTAVPNVVPRDPSPDVRDRVFLALDELEDAWQALDITC